MPRKYTGNAEAQIHSFLTAELNEGEWSTSRPGLFTLGKKRPVPFYKKLVGPQSRSRRSREEEILACTRSRTPCRPARSLVPIQTTLPRLQNAYADAIIYGLILTASIF